MGTCTITGGYKNPMWSAEACRAPLADLNKRNLDDRAPTRGNAGVTVVRKVYATGEGIVLEIDGERVRGQVWSDSPYTGCVWAKVFEGDARFAGEMWLVRVDKTGKVTDWLGSYHADGTEYREVKAA